MKKYPFFFQKRNWISFLMMPLFVFAQILLSAQTPSTIYLSVTLLKVAPENQAEYEKFVAETWKPVQQLRKQNGKIINWALFKVHFKGQQDEYNYASATYYDSFDKTQDNENWAELLKKINPKADAPAIIAKTQKIRSTVRQNLYIKTETVGTTPPIPFKFAVIGFVKAKPGQIGEALKLETNDWKPIHQTMLEAGQMVGWNVYSLVLPVGKEINHDYFTSNLFSSYEQVNVGSAYEAAFKKNGKDLQATVERISKATDLIRRELLELVVGLN